MWPQIIFAVVTMIVSVAVSLMMIKNQKTRTVAGEVEAPSVEYGTPIKVVLGSKRTAPSQREDRTKRKKLKEKTWKKRGIEKR